MPNGASGPIEVFVSYSHQDEALCKKLLNHLALLKHRGVINAWYDRVISPGQEWDNEISHYLDSASVILLLVSADFLASYYCYEREMKRALERHDARAARVIPVILREVDLEGAPFARLQALPKDRKPVISSFWHNEDEAFTDVAKGIRRIAEEIRANP